MKKQKRISVSFSKEYEEEYVYITNLSNSSDFICQAIRDKLKSTNGGQVELEKYIRSIAQQVFVENYSLSVPIGSKAIVSDTEDDQSLIEAADHFNF